MYHKKYHIHFVGIGGIGMSGIAELLLNLGYKVSGSDMAGIPKPRDHLAGLWGDHCTTRGTPDRPNARERTWWWASSAIRQQTIPELVAADTGGTMPIIPRAEMLAELMRLKYSIAVAGAPRQDVHDFDHRRNPRQPGGTRSHRRHRWQVEKCRHQCRFSDKGDFIVAEADESDGSFLKYLAHGSRGYEYRSANISDFYEDLAAIKRGLS